MLKTILILSHGQAGVESGFSLGKSSLQVNTKEESIVAKNIVRDHLLTNKIDRKNCKRLSKSFRKGKEGGFRERVGRERQTLIRDKHVNH